MNEKVLFFVFASIIYPYRVQDQSMILRKDDKTMSRKRKNESRVLCRVLNNFQTRPLCIRVEKFKSRAECSREECEWTSQLQDVEQADSEQNESARENDLQLPRRASLRERMLQTVIWVLSIVSNWLTCHCINEFDCFDTSSEMIGWLHVCELQISNFDA